MAASGIRRNWGGRPPSPAKSVSKPLAPVVGKVEEKRRRGELRERSQLWACGGRDGGIRRTRLMLSSSVRSRPSPSSMPGPFFSSFFFIAILAAPPPPFFPLNSRKTHNPEGCEPRSKPLVTAPFQTCACLVRSPLKFPEFLKILSSRKQNSRKGVDSETDGDSSGWHSASPCRPVQRIAAWTSASAVRCL